MTNDIRKLLNIKDLNIQFSPDSVQEQDNKLYIHCSLTYPVHTCPKCHHEGCVVKNGFRTSKVTYLESAGQASYLILNKQRFLCKQCHYSFTAQTQLVERNCSISRATKQKIASLATRTYSEKSIADQTYVSIHTVRRVVDTFSSAVRKRPTTLPKHLCFDEFKSTRTVNGAMSFIFCDATNHQVIDVVEDRRLRYLKAYFYRYSRKERKKVQTICIDMYTPYIELIRQLFPNAAIIIDRFHIVQALNRELNRYRIQWMNQVKYHDRRLYNKLKRYWKLFLKKETDLDHTHYRRFTLFDSLTNTGHIVDYLLDQDQVFKESYRMVQNLRCALEKSDYDQFMMSLHQATNQQLAPGLRRVLRTFRKFQPYISNTFDHPTITNGPIEGINNKIKVLKRNAYGYRKDTHFKNRILLISRLYVSGRKEKETKQQLVA